MWVFDIPIVRILNNIFGIVGVLCGIFGVIYAIINSRKTKPLYQVQSVHIIDKSQRNLLDDMVITYKGKEIDILTKTIIYFWNGGKKTLNRSDIVPTDKLYLQIYKGEILSARIVKTIKPENQYSIEVSEDKSKAILDFEYMDYREGAAIELVHTSSQRRISTGGTIKGLPKGVKYFGRLVDNESRIPFREFRNIYYIPALSSSGLLGLMGITGLIFSGSKDVVYYTPGISPGLYILCIIASILTSIFMYSLSRRKYPKKLNIEE